MTKEELLEDVQVGDIVKIYTESAESFEGKITDFGESGLKIALLNSNKAKRIMYGRITEYDIEEVEDTTLTNNSVSQIMDNSDWRKNVENSKEAEENSVETVEFRNTSRFNRKEIFGDLNIDFDREAIRAYWVSRLESEQKREYNRITDILNYAKKVNEYKLDSDRVRRAIGEYKKLAVGEKSMNVFIALIYHEFNDVSTAVEYYHKGGAYDVEFELSFVYGYGDLFEKAILAVEHNKENEIIVKWLCEYALENNDFEVILHVINHSEVYLGKALLFWYIDKTEFQMIPNKEDLFSKENILYLKSINHVNTKDNGDRIKEILSKEVNVPDTVADNRVEEKSIVYKGSISFYNKNGGYGTIKNLNGGYYYFYIKQVKDLDLQRILATESNYKRKVTYTIGVNFRGEIAADSIELDGSDYIETAETEYEYEGFLEDYDVYENRGRIRSGNKVFNFIFDEIKDPLLYADILSSPYCVQDLSVKFNAKNYKSKRTKKSSKIACDICGVKEYSKQEIDDFISQKNLTRAEVNKWLGVALEKNVGYFRAVDYEPLNAIGSISKEENESKQMGSHSALNTMRHKESGSGERKAVSLLLDFNNSNPFLNLKRDSSGKRYFQDAHRYMVGRKNNYGETVGVDLDKAEELFICAIKARDQINSSVANLVNIYIKRGGDDIVKGLQLLEAYGYIFPVEKLTNLRIQLIDKSGNFDALEQILLSAIPNSVKKNTVWQYMFKLAGIYYKQQKWDEAIDWSKKSLKYLDKNKSEFTQYQLLRVNNMAKVAGAYFQKQKWKEAIEWYEDILSFLEKNKYELTQYQQLQNTNLRFLLIAKYTSGDKIAAIKQAKQFMKNNPDDSVISSIVEGTFETNKTKTIIGDVEDIELQYEDDLFDLTNGEISLYLSDKLQRVDLTSAFSKISIVYEKLQDGRYIGNANDSNKAVKYINDNLLRKNKRGISADVRSEIFIGIARIISDSRENSNSGNGDKVAVEEVKKYVARYARYSADVFVEKYATVDSIRFLYIQALRYLSNGDDGNIIVATNMLIASFFVDSNKLPDELHDMGNSGYKDEYYQMDCVSIKDFLIATFMLQERQEYVKSILKKIYDKTSLRRETINLINCVLSSDRITTEYNDFEANWKRAKGVYYSNLKQLGKEVEDSINEYHMAESIRIHIQKIKDILDKNLLWDQDKFVIENYLKLISLISDTLGKYTVEEKIEGFKMAETEIEKLKSDIENSPTEFSYDYVYSRLDDLRFLIRARCDDLYQSSRPECTIFLSNNSVYVNDKVAEIAITFKNSEDKQDVEAVEINLKGSDGASFNRCEKKFTSIRSGEEQDYLATFILDERIVSEGQFEIDVSMKYRYWEAVDKISTASISEILPVTITDKENYTRIENKYNRIIRGSGVDVKTPELFKGRNELIDSICESMSSADGIMTKNRGIILWGQRRVGKNSVKDYLKEKIRSEYPDAYIIIELGSIGKCRNLRDVLITIINKTEDALMQDYEELYEKLISSGMEFSGYLLEKTESYMPEFSRFMDRLSGNLKKISEDEKNIPLFFIDEFSYLYEWIEKGEIDGKSFMRFWKSFIQDYGICSIIIAQDNIPVWKSRYENEFACMNHDNEITYLDYEGAKELICEPCQVEDKSLYTPEAVKLIYDWTKGSAYLIVIFCKHVIDYLNDNYMEKATKTIVQLVFEKEFIEKKEMFESDDFEPQIQDVANVGKEGDLVNARNKELLKEIASATITSSQARIDELKFFSEYGDQAQKIFVRLKERKIIEVERDKYVSISMPLLKFYLLREQSLLDKETLNKMIR